MLVISVRHEVWSKWFEKHDDTVLTLLLFPHCWNFKVNVIYAIDIESLHVTWTSPARFDPVFTNIDILSRGWDSRTTYHWWHPCFGFRHRALKNRVQGTQARMGAGQSASTPRSPTSSQLDLFILPPPKKKNQGMGWDYRRVFHGYWGQVRSGMSRTGSRKYCGNMAARDLQCKQLASMLGRVQISKK